MALQGSTCTISTYIHHAMSAIMYGRWTEGERLFAKAAALIVKEPAK